MSCDVVLMSYLLQALGPQGILGVGSAFLVDPIGACRGLAGIGARCVGPARDSRGLRCSEPPAPVGLGVPVAKGSALVLRIRCGKKINKMIPARGPQTMVMCNKVRGSSLGQGNGAKMFIVVTASASV